MAFMLPYKQSIYSPCKIKAHIVGMSNVRKTVSGEAGNSE